ncbi:hypothetical protein P0L94_04130 [Microbacter sp. GSS18]|nr:hypothetical protein P0L94_04130 [Microbacter sp. GSS18]
MVATLDATPEAEPQLTRAHGVQLTPAGRRQWRVTDRAGLVVGHLMRVDGDADRPFRARRFRPSTRAFVEVGAFWSADDAVDALRFSR